MAQVIDHNIIESVYFIERDIKPFLIKKNNYVIFFKSFSC